MSQYLELWREKLNETEIIDLSIGPAEIKRHASLLDLAAAGLIPTTLLTDLQEVQNRREGEKLPPDSLPKMAPALNALAIAVFVDPPLAETADDEHLAVASIPYRDRLKVFAWLNREVEPLREFREGSEQPDGIAPDGDDLPLSAVGDPGDSGRVGSVPVRSRRAGGRRARGE